MTDNGCCWLPCCLLLLLSRTLGVFTRGQARPISQPPPLRCCLLPDIIPCTKIQVSDLPNATGHAGPRACNVLARWLSGSSLGRAFADCLDSDDCTPLFLTKILMHVYKYRHVHKSDKKLFQGLTPPPWFLKPLLPDKKSLDSTRPHAGFFSNVSTVILCLREANSGEPFDPKSLCDSGLREPNR